MRPLVFRFGASVLLAATAAGCGDSVGPLQNPAAMGETRRLSSTAATVSGTTWNAAADFSPTSNPNGPWTSGWTPTLGGALTVYSATSDSGFGWGWHDPLNNVLGTPSFWKNYSTSTLHGSPGGSVALHSGCNANEYSVLRWSAPAAGSYAVAAQFFAGDQGNTDAHVLKNGNAASPLYAAASTSASPSFSTTVSLAAGETLDFVIGTGGDGCYYDNTPLTVQITAQAKAVVAKAGGPYTGNEGQAIAFSSAGSSDAKAGALTYAWSFGDGTSSALANPSKKYTDNGTYNVRLIVTNVGGQADTASTTATIANVAPTGKFTVSATRIASSAEGEEAAGADTEATLVLTPSKNMPEGTAYTLKLAGTDLGTKDRPTLHYALDCGQGAGFSAWSKTNTLNCPAIANQRSAFPIRAKVRDKDGAETLYTINLTITNAPPEVKLTATTATTIAVGGSLGVSGLFTDKGVNDSPWAYSINWGDGTVATTGSTSAQNTAIPASHTFGKAGTFKVQMSVKDKDGAVGKSTLFTVTVNP